MENITSLKFILNGSLYFAQKLADFGDLKFPKAIQNGDPILDLVSNYCTLFMNCILY
jgi:hypothetical protein